ELKHHRSPPTDHPNPQSPIPAPTAPPRRGPTARVAASSNPRGGCMRLLQDLKVALRTAVRARFVSVLAVLAFALGIGVTTAVFSIFNGVLLQPLPFPPAEQLVAVYAKQPACATCPASFPKYHDWRERNRVFAAIGGSSFATFVLVGNGDPTRVVAAPTTASFADVFGVPPMLGRWYTEEEDRPGGPKVVVLTYD